MNQWIPFLSLKPPHLKKSLQLRLICQLGKNLNTDFKPNFPNYFLRDLNRTGLWDNTYSYKLFLWQAIPKHVLMLKWQQHTSFLHWLNVMTSYPAGVICNTEYYTCRACVLPGCQPGLWPMLLHSRALAPLLPQLWVGWCMYSPICAVI